MHLLERWHTLRICIKYEAGCSSTHPPVLVLQWQPSGLGLQGNAVEATVRFLLTRTAAECTQAQVCNDRGVHTGMGSTLCCSCELRVQAQCFCRFYFSRGLACEMRRKGLTKHTPMKSLCVSSSDHFTWVTKTAFKFSNWLPIVSNRFLSVHFASRFWPWCNNHHPLLLQVLACDKLTRVASAVIKPVSSSWASTAGCSCSTYYTIGYV